MINKTRAEGNQTDDQIKAKEGILKATGKNNQGSDCR